MDLAQLTHSRTARRVILTTLMGDLNTAITNDNLLQVESILEKIKVKELKLLEVNEFLEVSSLAADVSAEVTSNDAFSDLVIDAKIAANRCLKRLASSSAPSVPVNARSNVTKTATRLPKLQIAKFDGTVADWERFSDQYMSGIGRNSDLTDVDKFSYLKGLLKESASLTIAGLSITDANYHLALQLLEEKYGDKQLLVAEHVKRLWEVKRVARIDNGVELRRLIEEFQKHIRSLELLGQDVTSMGTLLCPILLQSLPNPIVREWHRKNKGLASYNLMTLVNFVKEELKGIELTYSVLPQKENVTLNEQSRKKDNRSPSSASALVATEMSPSGSSKGKKFCAFCEEVDSHWNSQCPTYSTPSTRRTALIASNRCFRCFYKSHGSRTCDKVISCKQCHKPHNTLLCGSYIPKTTALTVNSGNVKKDDARSYQAEREEACKLAKDVARSSGDSSISTLVASAAFSRSRGQQRISLLQTLRVNVKTEQGLHAATLLLDNGSERSFVGSSLVKLLKLQSSGQEEMVIRSFGGNQQCQKSKVVPITLQANNGKEVKLSALEVPEICNGVRLWESSAIDRFLHEQRDKSWNQLLGPGEKSSVDILIGADQYWSIVTGISKKISSTLMANHTLFGWVLSGSAEMFSSVSPVVQLFVATDVRNDDSLDNRLTHMWELDRSGIMAAEEKSMQTLEDVEVLQRFKNTTTFSGKRYQVGIPWNEKKPGLEDNFDIALERLRRLLFSLQKDPELYERYKTALFEYCKNDHAEEVSLKDSQDATYYMPHHAIIKEDRATTKIRIVFDASSCSKDGTSLNAAQFAGPNLNPTIFQMLTLFRWHRIGYTTDLSKAFLQVRVHPEDRDATRFLWTDKPWKKGTMPDVKVFRMTSVLFGMKASPFLLAATIRHHATTHASSDADLANFINARTYVDDHVGGAETTLQAHQRSVRTYDLMLQGGMQFLKWVTNDADLRKLWAQDGLIEKEESVQVIKVLGLKWNPETDRLSLQHTALLEAVKNDVCTKRNLLEILARIYDPLGIVSPMVVAIKLLLQDLWRLKVGWDELMPEIQLGVWKQWKEELSGMTEVNLDRWMKVSSLPKFQLHTYVDANPRIYACVVYFRFQAEDTQEYQSCLVASRTRLAPIQPVSIPRLELLACVIGTRLTKSILELIPIQPSQIFFWSDSQVALAWINDVPSRWKLFVARRVQEVQANMPVNSSWNYCPTKFNIADLATRGQSMSKLLRNDEWWYGPVWLKNKEEEWPTQALKFPTEKEEFLLQEEKLVTTSLAVQVNNEFLFSVERYSTWQKMIRVTAWIMRFISKSKKQENSSNVSWLNCIEIRKAEEYWIMSIQSRQFAQEVQALKLKQEISRESDVFKFKPFLDNKNLLRLGGRLQFSTFTEAEKHPFLLRAVASLGELVELFILDRHFKTLHGGVQITLARVREDAWILRGRQSVRKAIYKCLTCRRWNAKPAQEVEAPLPFDRVNPVNAFEVCGVDNFGPLYVKIPEGTAPVYGCLFTCAVTRAVHLEVVSTLSTANFILAFRRFVARRGVVKIVYSDNAGNFVKTDRLLRESYAWISSTQTQEVAAQLGIEWRHIAPRAAWWGGFYERLVQSTKHHLRRTLGNARLTLDELTTIVIEVESVLNNRPLTTLSEDSQDGDCLTPAHFLLGKKHGLLTDSLVFQEDVPAKSQLLRRWNYRKRLMSNFWRSWRRDYLQQLSTAHTVKRASLNQEPIQLGDVVLQKEEKLPRGRWRMARVEELTTGRDGKVRSAMLRHADGTFSRRAIQHLCPLEIL